MTLHSVRCRNGKKTLSAVGRIVGKLPGPNIQSIDGCVRHWIAISTGIAKPGGDQIGDEVPRRIIHANAISNALLLLMSALDRQHTSAS